ncbi:dehydrogenase/reductase SDR family member 4-like [Corticium candelabrum]|uniref:dehydrogenase/reductase SDR family member 4-like n=1 Tax=Corticium candelabrum TaxID=121492 RepID=UPI002E25E28B|nr:dehydrogenase/reductase SDR family member 4-like [Corticium candelabrum]
MLSGLRRSLMSSATHSKRLVGKVAVVTASTDGIGFAIARKLAQEGARVVVSSRKETRIKEAVRSLTDEGLSVSGVVCHVGKKEDRENLIDKAVKEYGGLDILVSNAAVNPTFGPILETPEQAWDKIYEVNIKAAAMLTASCVPHLAKRGGGSIVYVSSIGGFNPFELLGAYSVSKTALFALTKAVSRECGPKKIRVNCIAPGIIRTKFSEALWSNQPILNHLLDTIPLKRIGEPEDCAGTVSFLCSDEARYITGETIIISGGMQSRL